MSEPPSNAYRAAFSARSVGLVVLVAVLATGYLTVGSAGAQTTQKPPACTALFPGAHSRTIGKTTWYNRQSSYEQVACYGFGLNPSAHFPISWEIVCGLLAQAIGAKAEGLSDFVDGACSGASIAADPKEPARYVEAVCSWASDLLEYVVKPVGVAASMGCTFAPSAGNYLGGKLESKHELDVAADIVGKGRCLKYSPTHLGSPWLAVTCAAGDPGFSTLPTAHATPPPTTTSYAVGSSFNDYCVVAWPTAPTRTTRYIQMTMTCSHVPEGEFLFTDVIYPNPNLNVTPSTGQMRVIGKIVDIAQSAYGYRELVVQATSIQLP